MTCRISRPPVGRLVHLIVGSIVRCPWPLINPFDFPHALCFSEYVSLFFLCFLAPLASCRAIRHKTGGI